MKCDNCDNEATVHEVTVRKGKKIEKHLCEQCAAGEGLSVQASLPINTLLSKFMMSTQLEEESETVDHCPECGMTFAEFRQSGLLGCAACYDSFEDQLTSLIERAQEGRSRHVGRTPASGPKCLDRENIIASLRQELDEAVASERYERAAQIRDELRTISESADADDDDGD